MPLEDCNELSRRDWLDAAYVSERLGINARAVSQRLHRLKKAAGIGGRSVAIRLDDGEVYDPTSGEGLGNLYDEN